jgi:hypothetical protein
MIHFFSGGLKKTWEKRNTFFESQVYSAPQNLVVSMDQKMFAILVGRKGVRIDDLHPTAVQVVSSPEEQKKMGRLQDALCGTTNIPMLFINIIQF